MKKTSSISAQVESDVKQDAEKIFHGLGMTPSEAIALFYKQVANRGYMPLDFKRAMNHKELESSPAEAMNYIKLYSSPDDDLMLQEEAIFRENQTGYQQQYPNEFVAIYQGEVVDHDVDDDALIERRLKKYGDNVVLIRHVDSDPDEVKTIRSHILL